MAWYFLESPDAFASHKSVAAAPRPAARMMSSPTACASEGLRYRCLLKSKGTWQAKMILLTHIAMPIHCELGTPLAKAWPKSCTSTILQPPNTFKVGSARTAEKDNRTFRQRCAFTSGRTEKGKKSAGTHSFFGRCARRAAAECTDASLGRPVALWPL